MDDEEQQSQDSLDAADAAIQKKLGELLDMNHLVMQTSRQMAHNVLGLIPFYQKLIEITQDIAELHAVSSRLVAEATGDAISAEWGITKEEIEDEEEDE